MKLSQKAMSRLAVLLLSGVLLTSCSEVPYETGGNETEADHAHEYHLQETVESSCAGRGYQLYACACGDSFKSLLPSAHNYVEMRDISDRYVKRVCTKCGDYSIRREQTYTFHIDFEGVDTVEEAGTQAPYVEYYGRAGTSAEIRSDENGAYAELVSSNYYLLDTSEVMKKGQTFVLSFDVAFETLASGSFFSIIPFNKGDFSYNDGLIEIDGTGKLRFCAAGDSAYSDEVVIDDKGYNNIAVVGSLRTGLYDVYVNETLVRKDIPYIRSSDSLEKVYIRYLDRETGFVARIDNLKMYVAAAPEFLIDENSIYFN